MFASSRWGSGRSKRAGAGSAHQRKAMHTHSLQWALRQPLAACIHDVCAPHCPSCLHHVLRPHAPIPSSLCLSPVLLPCPLHTEPVLPAFPAVRAGAQPGPQQGAAGRARAVVSHRGGAPGVRGRTQVRRQQVSPCPGCATCLYRVDLCCMAIVQHCATLVGRKHASPVKLDTMQPLQSWASQCVLPPCRVEEAAAKARAEVQRQKEEQRRYQEVGVHGARPTGCRFRNKTCDLHNAGRGFCTACLV